MTFVRTGGSGSGVVMPAARPISMHLSSQAILRPSVRITCMPSRSCRTSSGVLPCTMFQYFEDTTGIQLMVKYLFSASSAAVVPPRRAETTAAPGLYRSALPPA